MGRRWTRDEEILAMALYCKIPFGQIHNGNKFVQNLAVQLGRSPGSVAMKMFNLARFDPTIIARGCVGLQNGSILDEEVWLEFNKNFDHLEDECTRILTAMKIQNNEDQKTLLPVGGTADRTVHTRINQDFFRTAVLASYEEKCCITGLSMPVLLNASHIKPWSESDPKTERTNPRNGLCLNALHDRAFDRGLITVDLNYKIIISQEVREHYTNEVFREYFEKYDGKSITLPHRFGPDKDFLEYHNSHIFLD